MEKPTRQGLHEIDFYDKPPVFNVPITRVHNYTPGVICEYREITGSPNRGYRKLFYHDHPDETPQLRAELQRLAQEVSEYKEKQQELEAAICQNEKSTNNIKKIVQVDRRFAEMVQDVVRELLEACDEETRKCIKQLQLPEFPKQIPVAYQWLLQQTRNGNSSLQGCLKWVHNAVMSDMKIDAKSMFEYLESYKKAKEERDRRGHPCSLSGKEKMEDIIKFVKDIAEGDEPLPEPYKDRDRELVKIAVSHWLKTHDQEAGPSGEANPTKGETSKTHDQEAGPSGEANPTKGERSKTHDQEAGPSGEAKRTKGKRSKRTKKTSRR